MASTRPVIEVEYPESDGKPMAESDLHRELLVYLIHALRRRFRGEGSVYVSGNLFVYFEKGNPRAVVAPDLFVVRGVPPDDRRTYKVWEEGKGPEAVVELTSPSTHQEDLGEKLGIYEALGVAEYFIFDPEGERFDPPFRAYRRAGQSLRRVDPDRIEGHRTVFRSEVMGLDLHGAGKELRLVDPETGEALPADLELYASLEDAERRIEEQSRRAGEESRRAASESRRATEESRRAEAAEAEVRRLREELARRPPAG